MSPTHGQRIFGTTTYLLAQLPRLTYTLVDHPESNPDCGRPRHRIFPTYLLPKLRRLIYKDDVKFLAPKPVRPQQFDPNQGFQDLSTGSAVTTYLHHS
jgi:hypothetical protein